MLDMSDVLNPMTQSECREWIEALRSGKYAQGKSALKNGNRYCCLGVEQAIHPQQCEFVNSSFALSNWEENSEFHGKYSRIPGYAQHILMNMNDDDHTFLQIAYYIEENILSEIPE